MHRPHSDNSILHNRIWWQKLRDDVFLASPIQLNYITGSIVTHSIGIQMIWLALQEIYYPNILIVTPESANKPLNLDLTNLLHSVFFMTCNIQLK